MSSFPPHEMPIPEPCVCIHVGNTEKCLVLGKRKVIMLLQAEIEGSLRVGIFFMMREYIYLLVYFFNPIILTVNRPVIS